MTVEDLVEELVTAKRASVLLNAVEGSYTIDLKKVAIMVAAPISEEEE